MKEHRKSQITRGTFDIPEGKINRSFPIHRSLLPMTLDADDNWLDDRTEVSLTVGDIRHMIRQHERAVSMIGEMLIKCNCGGL